MAVTDLHTLDISTPLDRLFSSGSEKSGGAVLQLISDMPTINVGKNVPIVMGGRAKGALVHEGGKKPDNGRKVEAKPFTTVKLVYSQRVTDEFMIWDESNQGDFVSRWAANIIKSSLPHDLDLVVIHGYDPHTNTQDGQLSDYITKTGSSILVPKTGDTAETLDTDLGSAIAALKDQNINGVAISTDAATALAGITQGNVQKYPGLGVFGLTGGSIAGMPAATSPEVGAVNETKFVIGDWTQLLLGFAGQATWKTIEFGNPDGSPDGDLQQLNQVCLRLETHFGFRVLDPKAFAVVAKSQD